MSASGVVRRFRTQTTGHAIAVSSATDPHGSGEHEAQQSAGTGIQHAVNDDRDRQFAASGWILGFIGGPLPAIFVYLVVDRQSWSRRFAVWAAVYWAFAWVVISGSLALAVSDTIDGAWPRFVAMGTVVVSLIVVAAAARRAQLRSRHEIEARRTATGST